MYDGKLSKFGMRKATVDDSEGSRASEAFMVIDGKGHAKRKASV